MRIDGYIRGLGPTYGFVWAERQQGREPRVTARMPPYSPLYGTMAQYMAQAAFYGLEPLP